LGEGTTTPRRKKIACYGKLYRASESSRLLWTRWWTFGFHITREIYWSAVWLSVPPEGPCSMELVQKTVMTLTNWSILFSRCGMWFAGRLTKQGLTFPYHLVRTEVIKFYRTFIPRFHNSAAWLIVSQFDPAHIFVSYFSKSMLISSFHLLLGLPSCLFPRDIPNKMWIGFIWLRIGTNCRSCGHA
jgi:hypothetical protein